MTRCITFTLLLVMMKTAAIPATEETLQSRRPGATPVTSAEQYIDYLKTVEEAPVASAPEAVVILFSRSQLRRVLADYDHHENTSFLKHLYTIDGGKVGVLGGFGIGAPALIHRMEELIAYGVKRFVAVGLAGSLTDSFIPGDRVVCTKALSEDGVGHLYLKPGAPFSYASTTLVRRWERFLDQEKGHDLPMPSVGSWSFPVIFRETKEDVDRVTELGCDTVEMEAGAFYAIAEEKGVEALALFVISDSLAGGVWHPELKDAHIKEKLKELIDLSITFCHQQGELE